MTKNWCRGPESNRYESLDSTDFKSVASACSATPANVEAAPRIELGIKVLQTSALPLGYAATMERETRFELATLALARRCSTTELFPHDGASGQNRTADTRIFSPLLYRLSYRGKKEKMATRIGFEPTISAVTGRHVNHYTTGPQDLL